MRALLLIVISAAAAIVSGCLPLSSALPPPLGHGPLIMPAGPKEGTDQLGHISAGVAVIAMQAGDMGAFSVVPGEANLSLRLAPRYDLTLTASSWMLHARGLLSTGKGAARVGLVHGLGVGAFWMRDESPSVWMFYSAEGGFLASYQASPRARLFVSTTYAWGEALPVDETYFVKTGTAAARAGVLVPVGELTMTHEIGYALRHHPDFPNLVPTHVLLYVLSIGVSL